jgi:FAD/FMN-containing dehydrogenase
MKSILPVWRDAPADAWLMREVKNRFDPRGLFNPGRFVDGI